MPQIFVSYRRADSPGTAGRLVDHLAQHFGAHEVFRDIESIEAGQKFDQTIRDAVTGATAALVLIGPRWLELRAPDGSRRLDDPRDFVRREIELALASTARVVPVLVDDARMPAADALPVSLQDLARHHAFEVTDRHWRHDAQDLIHQLDSWISPDQPRQHESLGRVALDAVAGFAPDLFWAIRRPREFLRRRTRGRRTDLLSGVVFLAAAVLLTTMMLISVYTPRESTAGFFLAALVVWFLVAVAISGPLWVGWWAVGARRHYARVLVIVLHQVAVPHVTGLLAIWIVLAALDWQSHNIVRNTIDEAMRLKSGAAVVKAVSGAIMPMARTGVVRLAMVTALAIALATALWLVRIWGAYRDALGFSRARSAGASVIAVVAAWLGVMLANAVVTFGR
jgi:hypothetical protein